jgi:Ca2+-binding RTX toxin-like protein
MRARAMTALAATVMMGALLASPASAQAAPPTCLGEPATIVSDQGQVDGTTHDDVIVSTAFHATVHALAGDDLVCTSGSEPRVSGGRGDDQLSDTGSDGTLSGDSGNDVADGADLLYGGTGADTLINGTMEIGGAGDDDLRPAAGGGLSWTHAPRPVTVNLVTGVATGWGHDTIASAPDLRLWGSNRHGDVLIGDDSPNWITERGGDTIHAGGGDDTILIWDHIGRERTASVYGDAGNDVISLQDRATGHFHGGPGDDQIIDRGVVDRHDARPVHLDGGRGDDSFSVQGNALPSLRGGSGTNSLIYSHIGTNVKQTLTVNAVRGTVTANGRVTRLRGFVSYELEGYWSRWTHFVGKDAAEALVYHGTSHTGPLTARMGGGDDTVSSGVSDDTVDGGAGFDTADLRGGTNTCTHVEAGPC